MTGRPPFKPTAAQRAKVELMKAVGWSNERIAAQLKISRNTLEKAFLAELEFGADSKRLQVLENLEKASKKGNASASKQLLDQFDVAATLRPNVPAAPEETAKPKLGKKAAAEEAAQRPDPSTEMGDLMARRMALADKSRVN
ncbi:MAG: hypothetical protein FD144_4778 [Rhodospirillaceae bacterium]|nr:MAG: hypothetical protein FD144_4778 [Rhodospirillaceae bacterium]